METLKHGHCLCAQCQRHSPMPLIYVAGPFRAETAWGIEQNIRVAESVGLKVARLGAVPVIPHSMYRFFQGTMPDDFWLNACLQLLRKCHAIVTVTNGQRSSGTLIELDAAKTKLHIPIFHERAPGVYILAPECTPLLMHDLALGYWIDTWKVSR